MNLRCWIGLLSVASALARGAPLLTRDFTAAVGEGPELPAGVTRVVLPENGACLELGAKVAATDLATVEVVPGTKCRLILRARVQGAFTVEQNDRAHIEAVQRRGRGESAYEVQFHETDAVPASAGGGGFFLTRDWYDYVHVFRVPPGVRQATIRLKPRGHVTQIARVTLMADDEDGAINNNPDFRYGELNYCGWAPQRDGRIFLRPDGRCVFRSGYGGSSPAFPLTAGRRYRMCGQGEGGHLNIHYYDADGKSIASRFLLRLSAGVEAAAELTPPEDCVSARVVAYGALLESFKVTALAD